MKRNMKYSGMYKPKMVKGGSVQKQWEMSSSPNTPGYEDYGTMYTVPEWSGLLPKSSKPDNSWEGFGNPANLQKTEWSTRMQSAPLRQQPTQSLGMDAGDYSIDNIRSQYMKQGGFTQKKGYFWNGHSMQKAVPGAYDTMWENGGAVIPKGFQQIPMHQEMGRYGLNLYQNGGMAKVPIQQHMGRYGLLLYKQGGSVPPTYTAYVNPSTKGMQYGGSMYKDGGIHIKPENKGKFTAWASAHGMGVQEAARHVMANKEDYSSTIVKRANFAKNAAGWKKQYGGHTRYDIGGVTDENPMSGATTFTGQNPAGMGTTTPTQNAYDPSTDPNNPVNQNIPMPQQGGYAASQGAVWDETGTTDTQQVSDTDNQQQVPGQPRRPFGTGYKNLLGAAMMYGQYAANQRQQKNLQAYGIQQGMTQMNPTRTTFSKGVYNQQGQMMPIAQYGGSMEYKMGGSYEMDDATIEHLKRMGYKFKMM